MSDIIAALVPLFVAVVLVLGAIARESIRARTVRQRLLAEVAREIIRRRRR